MPCIDRDKFNLIDHGHSADVALRQLLLVPSISNGALGSVIRLIQQTVLPMSQFTWIPQAGTNAGSAAGFFKIDNASPDRIALNEIRVTVMEDKRGQVVHELVHGVDMLYFHFNLSHPPLADGLSNRVPVLYLFPLGNVWKYNVMDQPFINPMYLSSHANTLTFCAGLIRNNNLLKNWQRAMLMTQLDYAARPDKVHVEFTANVAQCLSLIYQWGFTGNETGGLGNPRSIAIVIKRMESVLNGALQSWRSYVPLARKVGSVIQFTQGDKRMPELGGPHFERNQWWKQVTNPLGF